MKLIRRLVLSSIVFLVLFSYGLQDEKTINVRSVKNEILTGELAGNRNLEFGVRNILEEILQDEDYFIDPDSDHQLDVSILFFGVQNAGAQLAIYQRNVSITNIIIKGTLYVDGKKKKSKVVKGQSKDISTATLIIDEGGSFSQASVSTALKKASIQLINNLKL